MSREVDALFAFGDLVEQAGVAQRSGATLVFWYEGREYLLDVRAYDVTGVDDE
ncbi:hypothetical protein Pan2_95 [Pseudanabaena phage Pan2]|nr:hypothetical protein Pan2_95 [Pseudanabaena phage Pan2]